MNVDSVPFIARLARLLLYLVAPPAQFIRQHVLDARVDLVRWDRLFLLSLNFIDNDAISRHHLVGR